MDFWTYPIRLSGSLKLASVAPQDTLALMQSSLPGPGLEPASPSHGWRASGWGPKLWQRGGYYYCLKSWESIKPLAFSLELSTDFWQTQRWTGNSGVSSQQSTSPSSRGFQVASGWTPVVSSLQMLRRSSRHSFGCRMHGYRFRWCHVLGATPPSDCLPAIYEWTFGKMDFGEILAMPLCRGESCQGWLVYRKWLPIQEGLCKEPDVSTMKGIENDPCFMIEPSKWINTFRIYTVSNYDWWWLVMPYKQLQYL